ncbi:sensor histidine kinase [Hymenobacter gelipurpurascens]|uniref:sensor histidine kinase n=1 Tax=Hymenobacter gelipurpurascens TaxID=89968 RepID=UPI001BAFABD4|nr:histidine kinase [Hymenobacter gelipurpurascens]
MDAAEPIARRGWRTRLRSFLRPTNWSAAPEARQVPRWVHILLWVWLLAIDALKLASPVSKLPHFLGTASDWQPLLPLLGRLVLEDAAAAALFYLTWRWLIPRTLGRAQVGQYVLLSAFLVIPYALIVGGITYQTSPKKATNRTIRVTETAPGQKKPVTTVIKPTDSSIPEAWMRVLAAGFVGAFIVGSSSALRVTGDYIRGQRNRREMERQQLLTELAMLKTQINPHFLFNTLNNIYSLTSRKSDKAPEAVLRLAEIMRYLLYESSTDTVPLSREVAHLNAFLDLQRLRLPASAPDAIRLDITGTPPDCTQPIAPLMLLPLVENAFKHGDLAARPVAVHIKLDLATDGMIRFSVHNFVASSDATRDLPKQPGGVGLVNLRRRLELLYPNRYSLEVEASAEQHKVTLTLLS